MTNFDSIANNFMGSSNWQDTVELVMKDPHFGTKFYETFFMFSPLSRTKFKGLQSQAKTFVRMLKLIFDKTTESEKKRYQKNMRRAHNKQSVNIGELNAMSTAMLTVCLMWLVDNNKLGDLPKIQQGLTFKFNSFGRYFKKQGGFHSTSSIDSSDGNK
jgi:hypothetical protein